MSLLGEPLIDVSPASTGHAAQGRRLHQIEQAARRSCRDVAGSANEGIVEATALLKDIRGGKGTVGKLFTDEQLYKELNAFIDSANAVTRSRSTAAGARSAS